VGGRKKGTGKNEGRCRQISTRGRINNERREGREGGEVPERNAGGNARDGGTGEEGLREGERARCDARAWIAISLWREN